MFYVFNRNVYGTKIHNCGGPHKKMWLKISKTKGKIVISHHFNQIEIWN